MLQRFLYSLVSVPGKLLLTYAPTKEPTTPPGSRAHTPSFFDGCEDWGSRKASGQAPG